MPGRRGLRSWRVATCTALLVAVSAAAAFAAYPHSAPNDPNYDPVERGFPASCLTQSVNSEQHYLYSFISRCTPNAHDPENAAGMSVDKALELKNSQIAEELNLPPVKIHCSVLAEDAIKAAIADWKKKRAAQAQAPEERPAERRAE